MDIFIWQGDTVTINGFDFWINGLQKFKTTASDGCDSTIIFEVFTINPMWQQITERLCSGTTYTGLSGQLDITETGVYVDTLVASGGCDSLVTSYHVIFEEAEILDLALYYT